MSDPAPPPTPGPETRCGFIAVIGAPNAGKSTLVNALVGAKVSIVSRKVQTTRVPVRGIANVGDSQLVFVDTPGLFVPKKRLDTAMVEAAWGGARDADIILLVIDAVRGIDDDVGGILDKLTDVRLPRLAVLNKIDKLDDKGKLLELVGDLQARLPFEAVFMISATEGAGVDELGEGLLDVEGRSARQSAGVAGHQFEGAVESPGGGHLVEADTEGVLEQGPVVGLREVVEDPHQDGCGRAGRVGHGPPSNVSQRVRITTLALAPLPTVWASATRASAT